jgi:hypothetical protein
LARSILNRFQINHIYFFDITRPEIELIVEINFKNLPFFLVSPREKNIDDDPKVVVGGG